MIADYSVPDGVEPNAAPEPITPESTLNPATPVGPAAVTYHRASWHSDELAALTHRLGTRGREALATISDTALLAAWEAAIHQLLDPDSAVRRATERALHLTSRLSPPALQAALEAMLSGTVGPPAEELMRRAGRLDRHRHGLVAAVLAGNVPALAVQVLLPALALRRPLLLKSPSTEFLLAPLLVRLLGNELPALSEGLAAITWQGGDSEAEDVALEAAETVVAFGGDSAVRSVGRRRPDSLTHGPAISLAIVGRDADLAAAATGLARDIALFEQRGCLSVQAIFTDADEHELAVAVGEQLERLGVEWPATPDVEVLAAVQQLRQEAALRNLWTADLPIGSGTVVVEPELALRPAPGGRSVRVHPLADLGSVESILGPHRGAIQGVALAGATAQSLQTRLRALGATRTAPPGQLQRADALWENGREHLLERMA